MAHLLNETFDKVVCINLVERTDKKQILQEKFDKLGIVVEWYTAVKFDFLPSLIHPIVDSRLAHFNKTQPYEIGAALSHYHVIKQAMCEGAKNIFIFEDDILFQKNFNDRLDSYWKLLPDDWDMLMFYSFMYHILPENIRISNKWIKSFKSWSLMAYGMGHKAMVEYLVRQNAFFTIADKVSFDMQEDKNLKIYSAAPTLCIPNPGLVSNIRGQNMNYKNNPTVLNLGFSDSNYE